MSGEGPGQFLSPDDALDDSWSADDLRSTSAPLLPMQSYSYTSLEAGQSSTVLLARDWMSVQQVTFTNWFNNRLGGSKSTYAGPKVTDLSISLYDGILLIKLLENLTAKKIKGYVKSPKFTAQVMVNLDLAFQHMSSEGIKLIGIGSQNIVQGDLKRILGLVWTLIQKYQLRMRGTEVSTKTVMIQWLQGMLPGWKIENLTTDWNDGRCLIALINEVKPGIAPSTHTLDPTKRRNNCTLALRIAKNHLKIPQLIAPENIADPHIDELSMMTYLSYFCDPAQARLMKWVKKTIPHMNIANFSNNWTNGIAFGALLEANFPGLCPEWTQFKKENAAENVKQVFAIAKHRLGVEPCITAKELASGVVEELKIQTYILRIREAKLKPLPEEILVSGPGLLKGAVGKQTHFEIDTTQAGPGQLFIDAYYKDGKKMKFSLQEKRPGILTLSYTPEECGVANFDILWSDLPLPKSPFSVTITDVGLVKVVDFEHHQRLVRVNIPITLKLETKSAGKGTITAHLKYDNEAPITVRVSSSPRDPTTTLWYTPPKAGKPKLHIFWNGEELTHLTIPYTVIDSRNYKIVVKPQDRMYRTFEHADFTVQSEGKLPLEVLQMTAIYGDIQIPISFKSAVDNVGIASFTPTLPGVYRIEVACIDKLVEGSPFRVKVVDPSRCKILGSIPKHLQYGVSHDFRVSTGEAGTGTLELECAEQQMDSKFTVERRVEKEVQILSVTPRKEGEFLIGLKFHETHIPSSPFWVTVCDPRGCSVTGDLVVKKPGLVGKPLRFRISVRESAVAFGIKPVVKAIGPSAKYSAEIRTTDDKTYMVQFTPWEIGTHEISVTYGGFHVPKSPFLVAIMGFDSNICSATGTGLQEAITGIPSQFVVIAKQSGLLDDGTLVVKVNGVINQEECKVRARDNKNGSYNIAYMTQTPGAYLITITAAGKHIPGSPFRLTAQPGPEADKCTMFGPALQPDAILTIGKPIDFSVDTSAAGTGELTVKAVGPGGAYARVFIAKTSKHGVHDIKLDPVRHGKYRVSVKWYGIHIPGSPFLLKIFPGADASKCKAYGPGLEDGIVGKVSTFTIETRDAGAGVLKVRLHGVKDAFKIEIKPIDQSNVRTLHARYDPRKPGEYLVTIKWAEKNIPGSPFRVKISGEALVDESDDSEYGMTPRNPELDTITEDEEEEEEEVKEGEMRRTIPQRKKPGKKKPRKKPHFIPVVPVAMGPGGYVHPHQMPVFDSRSRNPYQFAFIPPAPGRSKGPKKKASRTVHAGSPTKEGSATSMPSGKMVTFSGLQQVQKHARSYSAGDRGPVKGEYHGQATVTQKALRQRIVRSSSDSESVRHGYKKKKNYRKFH